MYGELTPLISIVTNGPYVVLMTVIDNLSSLEALLEALNNLDNLCDTVEESYNASLTKDSFERWDEKS